MLDYQRVIMYMYIRIYIYIHSIYTYSIPGKIPAFLLSAFRQSGASQVRVATARDQHLWRPGFPPYGAVISGCWWVRVWSIHTILGVQSFSERGTAMPGSNGRDMCMSIRVYHVSVWEYRRMSFYHVRPFWQVLFRLRHGNSPMLLDIDNILLHSHFFYILPSGNLT
jgi:hypothetical protein